MTASLPVPAAERTLRLLELTLAHPRGVTPQEYLENLDTSRSTLFALLRTLKTLGYLEQRKRRGRYRPGPRLLAWRGSSPGDPQDLLTAFYQETAHAPLTETLALAVFNPPDVLILAQSESPERLRSAYAAGQRLGIKECAAGPVLIPSPPENVRTQAYACHETSETVELALPICADGHRPEAALLVSAPRARQTSESLLRHLAPLREMAARLSYRLGAPTYAPYHGPIQTQIGPTAPLSAEAISAFLKGPWAASLACVRPDGKPHVVPVWHEWDGRHFYLAAWEGSRWGEYLLANPAVSLTVDEPWPPLRRVTAHGRAHPLEESELPGGTAAILNRLSQRYLGQSLNFDQPWRAFRIAPDQLRGWRGLQMAGS
jgi:DNA-binding IclR family transcriptional regulator